MRGTAGFRTALPVPVLLGTLVSGCDSPAAPTTATTGVQRVAGPQVAAALETEEAAADGSTLKATAPTPAPTPSRARSRSTPRW